MCVQAKAEPKISTQFFKCARDFESNGYVDFIFTSGIYEERAHISEEELELFENEPKKLREGRSRPHRIVWKMS